VTRREGEEVRGTVGGNPVCCTRTQVVRGLLPDERRGTVRGVGEGFVRVTGLHHSYNPPSSSSHSNKKNHMNYELGRGAATCDDVVPFSS